MRNYNEVEIKKYYICYRLNGKRHRTDGPAYIFYKSDGSLGSEAYYLNDKYHRTDGPAIICYNRNGQVSCEEYYLNDKFLSQKEFDKLCPITTK